MFRCEVPNEVPKGCPWDVPGEAFGGAPGVPIKGGEFAGPMAQWRVKISGIDLLFNCLVDHV